MAPAHLPGRENSARFFLSWECRILQWEAANSGPGESGLPPQPGTAAGLTHG